jgi:uncharacterized protein YegL
MVARCDARALQEACNAHITFVASHPAHLCPRTMESIASVVGGSDHQPPEGLLPSATSVLAEERVEPAMVSLGAPVSSPSSEPSQPISVSAPAGASRLAPTAWRFMSTGTIASLLGDGSHKLFQLVYMDEHVQNGFAVEQMSLNIDDTVRLINVVRPDAASPNGREVAFDVLDQSPHHVIGLWGPSSALVRVLASFSRNASLESLDLGKKPGLYLFRGEIKHLDTTNEESLDGSILFVWPGETENQAIDQGNPLCKFVRKMFGLCSHVIYCLSAAENEALAKQNTSTSRQKRAIVGSVTQRVTREDRVSIGPGFHLAISCEPGSSAMIVRSLSGLPGLLWTCENPPQLHLAETSANLGMFEHLAQLHRVQFALSPEERLSFARESSPLVKEQLLQLDCELSRAERDISVTVRPEDELFEQMKRAFWGYQHSRLGAAVAQTRLATMATGPFDHFAHIIDWKQLIVPKPVSLSRQEWVHVALANMDEPGTKVKAKVRSLAGECLSAQDFIWQFYQRGLQRHFRAQVSQYRFRELLASYHWAGDCRLDPDEDTTLVRELEQKWAKFQARLPDFVKEYRVREEKQRLKLQRDEKAQELVESYLRHFEDPNRNPDKPLLTVTEVHYTWYYRWYFKYSLAQVIEGSFTGTIRSLPLRRARPDGFFEPTEAISHLPQRPCAGHSCFSLGSGKTLLISKQGDYSFVDVFSTQKQVFRMSIGKHIVLVDYDEASRLLALYAEASLELVVGEPSYLVGYFVVYHFHESFTSASIIVHKKSISDIPGLEPPYRLSHMVLLPTLKQLVFITLSGTMMKYDFSAENNAPWMKSKHHFAQIPDRVWASPNGSMILCAFEHSRSEHSSELEDDSAASSSSSMDTSSSSSPSSSPTTDQQRDRFVMIEPFVTASMSRLPPFETDLDGRLLEYTVITQYTNESQQKQVHLIQFDVQTGEARSFKLDIETQTSAFHLARSIDSRFEPVERGLAERRSTMLDFVRHAFDKFPTRGCLEPPISPKHITVALAFDSISLNESSIRTRVQAHLSRLVGALQAAGKPIEELGLLDNLTVTPLEGLWLRFLEVLSPEQAAPFGWWIRSLICSVPLQIARAEGNELIVLSDGKLVAPTAVIGSFRDLAREIGFGMLDAVFRSHTGDIRVVSSMGKQSTGKSYTLNHLTGTMFDISGGRCTDGCWMSLRMSDDGSLLVVLDFEGIGSFERTDTEDMLLSILNAAVSNMTLFKTDYSFDRTTEAIFSQFQSGVSHIKGDDRLFRGIFGVIIKDVAESAVVELHRFFESKLGSIISRNADNNFLSQMYQSQYAIVPFSPLGTVEYYEQLDSDLAPLATQTISPFRSLEFREMLVRLMAKLALKDWTSLDGQDLVQRIQDIRDQLDAVIRTGKMQGLELQSGLVPLTSLDDGTEISCSQAIDVMGDVVEVADDVIELSNPPSFASLKTLFEQLFSFSRTGENHVEWMAKFSAFIKAVVDRRVRRVESWVSINLAKFPINDEIQALREFVALKLEHVKGLWDTCSHSCSECHVRCIWPAGSHDEHKCDTDHLCTFDCSFCREIDGSQRRCSEKLGHAGRHNCRESDHTCQDTCIFSHLRSCAIGCSLPHDHEGDHRCNSAHHFCQEICSNSRCKAVCQLNGLVPHTVHKCHSQQCNVDCCVDGCGYKCSVEDHFHEDPELSARYRQEQGIPMPESPLRPSHMCNRSHRCPHECESAGMCEVRVEAFQSRVEERVFEGQRGRFTYQLVREAIGSKRACCIEIPAGCTHHEGDHRHTLDPNVIHTCDQRCPSCGYLCELPYGHQNPVDGSEPIALHRTAHGNMRNTQFVAESSDIDIGERRYVAGESGTAEMCDMFCRKLGRGHIHIALCDALAGVPCTHAAADGRRHETCRYHPDTSVPKDELTHSLHWRNIGFEDPCSAEERDQFGRCGHYCPHPDHPKDEPKKHCELALWHPAATRESHPGRTVSVDGHVFDCTHRSSGNPYHVVMALDGSGSMIDQPWRDLCRAVKQFQGDRSRTGAPDLLSIIIYDDTPQVACERRAVSNNIDSLLVQPRGGTCFGPAINMASEVISRTDFNQYRVAFLFMSDGRPTDSNAGDQAMAALRTRFAAHPVTTFTIAFGSADVGKLQQLATIAGGTFHQSVDGVALANTFREIASSLSTRVAAVARR